MEPVVYIDMLFMLNFIMNSAVIFATAVLLQKEFRIFRLLAVSSASAIYSTVMFFPQISFLYSAVIKLFFWLITAFAAFPEKRLAPLFRNTLTYLAANLIFGGTMFFLIFFTGFGTTVGSVVSNGEIYLDISFSTLLASAFFAYCIIYTLSYIKTQNIKSKNLTVGITIFFCGNSISATALCDTGCTLSDPITSYPAIIISPTLAKTLFTTEESLCTYSEKYRILPFSTIDRSKGFLHGFIPDKVLIEEKTITRVVIGISETDMKDYPAILNYKLMETSVSGKAVTINEPEKTA